MRKIRWIALAAFVLGAAAGVLVDRYRPAASGGNAVDASRVAGTAHEPSEKRQNAKYICPMHPEIVKNEPGTCPICGMRLVPAAVSPAAAQGAPDIAVSATVVNSLSVRTARVQRETLWRQARVSAYIQSYTPGGTRAVHAPIAGRVAMLHAALGQRVRMGDALLEIESPGRAEAQARHLQTLAAGDAARIEDSRARLRALAFSGADIQRLEALRAPESALKISAPHDGEIVALNLRVGAAIEPNAVLLTLRMLGETAVDADLFRDQLLWIKSGDRAELRLPHLPGQAWKGTVVREGVQVNPQKRTYLVRLNVPLPEGLVVANMTGEVRIFGDPRKNALTIPRDALIRTEQGSRVVRALGAGRFKPVAVTPGLESGERVEIVSGLRAGDEVVVSAQFLIDSESSLRAEFLRLAGPPAGGDPKQTPADHGHAAGDHEHPDREVHGGAARMKE